MANRRLVDRGDGELTSREIVERELQVHFARLTARDN
jgi:hypothetical protein